MLLKEATSFVLPTKTRVWGWQHPMILQQRSTISEDRIVAAIMSAVAYYSRRNLLLASCVPDGKAAYCGYYCL